MDLMASHHPLPRYLKTLHVNLPATTRLENVGTYKLETGCVRICSQQDGRTVTQFHVSAGTVFDIDGELALYAEAVVNASATRLSDHAQIDGRLLIESLVKVTRSSMLERQMFHKDLTEHVWQGLVYLSELCCRPGQGGYTVDVVTLSTSLNRDVGHVSHALEQLARQGRALRREGDLVIVSP